MNSSDRTKAGVLVAAIVVVLVVVGFQIKKMMAGDETTVVSPSTATASKAPPPSTTPNLAAPTTQPPVTQPGVSTPPSQMTNPAAKPGDVKAGPGQNFATGPGVVTQPPAENPFKKVLSDTKGVSAKDAQALAEQSRRNMNQGPTAMRSGPPPTGPGPLPPLQGDLTPVAPGAAAESSFLLKGTISDPSGPMAVIKDGSETVFLSRGAKLHNGMVLRRIGDGYAIFALKKKTFRVVVGGGLGSG